MPEPPTGIPIWVWKLVAWIVGGVTTVIITVFGWVGKRYVQRRDQQIRDLRAQIHEEHGDVEEKVDELESKVDRILDHVES